MSADWLHQEALLNENFEQKFNLKLSSSLSNSVLREGPSVSLKKSTLLCQTIGNTVPYFWLLYGFQFGWT